MNATKYVIIENAFNATSFPSTWAYIGVSLATLLYDTVNDQYKTKLCAYIYGTNSEEHADCAIADMAYEERWQYPYYWETRVGGGYKGFIYTLYMWSFAKAQTNLYYTPRKNTPTKDQCTAFDNQQSTECPACD